MFTVSINFPDRCVSYETFLNDLSSRMIARMQQAKTEPEFISQRKAYKMFGRGNVDRWREQRRIKVYIRPGKVEYRTADLRVLQATEQDYRLNRLNCLNPCSNG